MADVKLTNYELNQQAYASVPALEDEELQALLLNVGD